MPSLSYFQKTRRKLCSVKIFHPQPQDQPLRTYAADDFYYNRQIRSVLPLDARLLADDLR
jgi:hypothetical protein